MFVTQAKPVTPDAAYWRQKYMETLDKYNTLTHDQERSTIANLQSQVDCAEEEPRDPRSEGGAPVSSASHPKPSGDCRRAA